MKANTIPVFFNHLVPVIIKFKILKYYMFQIMLTLFLLRKTFMTFLSKQQTKKQSQQRSGTHIYSTFDGAWCKETSREIPY